MFGKLLSRKAGGLVLRVNGRALSLREGSRLTARDVPGLAAQAGGTPVAEVSPHPADPLVLGLKNLSSITWTATLAGGEQRTVEPGRAVRLAPGTRVHFGTAEATIVAGSGAGGFWLETGGRSVELTRGLTLTAGELAGGPAGVVAEVMRNPQVPNVLGLKNLSGGMWKATVGGTERDVAPGQTVRLEAGVRLLFGQGAGAIVDPPRAWSRLRLPAGRRKWVAGGLSGAAVLAAGLTAWFLWRGRLPPVAPVDPSPQGTAQSEFAARSDRLQKFLSGQWSPGLNWSDSGSTSVDLHPGRPCKVALADEISVALPAGCVTGEQRLTVKKQVVAQKYQLVRYELQLSGGEAALQQPVTVTFPYAVPQPAPGTPARAPIVYHVHRDGSWEALAAQVDPTAQTAAVSVKNFSWLVPDFLASDRITRYRQCRNGRWVEKKGNNLVTSTVFRKVLAVPYCSQGDYPWCAAAALTMLLCAYDKPAHIWDIARAPIYKTPQIIARAGFPDAPISVRADPATAMVKAYTDVASIFRWYGLEVDQDYLGHFDWEGLNGYLIECIDQRRPVAVNLGGYSHAVVVVGYDRDNLYINDPCGHLTGLLGKAPATDWYTPPGKDDNAYIASPISWDKWNEQFTSLLNPVGTSYNGLFRTTCVAVTSPMSDHPKLVNLDIIPPEYLCLDVSRQKGMVTAAARARRNEVPINFWWNGMIDKGYGFSEAYPELYRRGTSRLCNSDVVTRIQAAVSNASGEPVKAKARCLLDGKPLGVSASAVAVDARSATQYIPVPDVGDLDFRKAPLRPGNHRLTFEVLVDEQVRDSLDFMLDFGPALVDNVRAIEVGDDELEIKWDPNLEERVFGLPMGYRVWQFDEPRIHLSAREMDVARVDSMALFRDSGAGGVSPGAPQRLLAVVGPGVHQWRLKMSKQFWTGRYFGVTALDPESGLSSPDCQFIGDKDPPLGPVLIVGGEPGDWQRPRQYPDHSCLRENSRIRFRCDALRTLPEKERLVFWIQRSATPQGPWETADTCGIVGVRAGNQKPTPDNPHPRFYTDTALLRKDAANDNECVWSVSFPGHLGDSGPFYRIAMARFSEIAEQWSRAVRERKKVRPEDTRALFSAPLAPTFDIVIISKIIYGYPAFDAPHLEYSSFGRFGSRSTAEIYVSVGGVNHGSTAHSPQKFTVSFMGKTRDFWAHPSFVPSDRRLPLNTRAGECQVRLPTVPLGKTEPLVIKAQHRGKLYTRTIQISRKPLVSDSWPDSAPIRQIDYDLRRRKAEALRQWDLGGVDTSAAREAQLKSQLAQADTQIRQLAAKPSKEPSESLRQAYAQRAEVQYQDFLLAKAKYGRQRNRWAGTYEMLDLYRQAIRDACELGYWPDAEAMVQTLLKERQAAIASGVPEVNEKALASFDRTWFEQMAEWAFYSNNLEGYEEALKNQQRLGMKISADRYEELADLLAGYGNTAQATLNWIKAEDLRYGRDPDLRGRVTGYRFADDVQFYDRNHRPGPEVLREIRPGWWPGD